jgi:hypothetical protein
VKIDRGFNVALLLRQNHHQPSITPQHTMEPLLPNIYERSHRQHIVVTDEEIEPLRYNTYTNAPPDSSKNGAHHSDGEHRQQPFHLACPHMPKFHMSTIYFRHHQNAMRRKLNQENLDEANHALEEKICDTSQQGRVVEEGVEGLEDGAPLCREAEIARWKTVGHRQAAAPNIKRRNTAPD